MALSVPFSGKRVLVPALGRHIILQMSRQDLNASLMTGSERVVDHTTFAELTWKRDPFSPFMFELPQGFQRLAHLFTDEFIEVIEDINALQYIRNSLPQVCDDAVTISQIDNQQAWIESRLWALPKGSSFQECCNYAAYLSANILCCKVWRTSAIPVSGLPLAWPHTRGSTTPPPPSRQIGRARSCTYLPNQLV